jgi:hypothetical protein
VYYGIVRVFAAGVFFVAGLSQAGQWGSIASDAAPVSPAETHRFLEAICAGNATATGCSVCPDETAFKDTAENWKLRTITFGHFLTPRSEDAFVAGFGCEPHSALMSGAYLFTKEGSGWRKVRYTAGQNADDCKKLTGSDGRDRLVCEASDMHQGVADWFLYLMDAGRGREAAYFFDVNDTLGSCTKLPDGDATSGEIESVSFVPASAPQTVRIVVTARLGKAAIPDKLLENCAYHQGGLRLGTVRRQYGFLFDGENVVPSPGNPSTEYTRAVAPRTFYHTAK